LTLASIPGSRLLGVSRGNAQELSSGALARATGTSTDTLRHYERRGLLPAARRLPNGYRRFPPAAVARVNLIQRAVAMGFGLQELSRILKSKDRGRPPCREVRALAAEKLESLEHQIERLTEFRETLRRTLAAWDRRLEARGDASEPAGLLESLSANLESASAGSSIWRGSRFDRRHSGKKETR
jgi:DNA-binding transcriptional MerR regulator